MKSSLREGILSGLCKAFVGPRRLAHQFNLANQSSGCADHLLTVHGLAGVLARLRLHGWDMWARELVDFRSNDPEMGFLAEAPPETIPDGKLVRLSRCSAGFGSNPGPPSRYAPPEKRPKQSRALAHAKSTGRAPTRAQMPPPLVWEATKRNVGFNAHSYKESCRMSFPLI